MARGRGYVVSVEQNAWTTFFAVTIHRCSTRLGRFFLRASMLCTFRTEHSPPRESLARLDNPSWRDKHDELAC